MRKIDELKDVLKQIKEDDDAVGAIGAEPGAVSDAPLTGADVTDEPVLPLSHDNKFFGQLMANDEFTDIDDPTIRYKVVSDPIMDDQGVVTSLPCEVIDAPEGNVKGVAVGDSFDAISEMPGGSASADKPPVDDVAPIEEPLSMAAEALKRPGSNLKPSSKPLDLPTGYPYDFPTTDKPGATPKKPVTFSPSGEMAGVKGAVDAPEKGKEVDASEKYRGHSLRRKFRKIREAQITVGAVQEVRQGKDGKEVVVRMGKGFMVVIPYSGGDLKTGDLIEVEDLKKVIGKSTKKMW